MHAEVGRCLTGVEPLVLLFLATPESSDDGLRDAIGEAIKECVNGGSCVSSIGICPMD